MCMEMHSRIAGPQRQVCLHTRVQMFSVFNVFNFTMFLLTVLLCLTICLCAHVRCDTLPLAYVYVYLPPAS